MSNNSLKIIHRSNYIVYIDDVRVDQFLVNWQSSLGLSANQASASLTFFRAPAMDDWKAYLSKVKIFAENPFTKKFNMVFEGDIISRSWDEKQSHMGLVTFHCAGFYHWLEVKIPMAINATDEMNPLQRFIYEAQNIDIEKVRAIITSDAEILLKDNNVQGVIDQLFEKVTVGYYEAAGDNTNFGFSKIKDRFVLLSDVKKEFRESGFLDLFTFSKASYIDSFSAYLVEVIEQLMMEFYQDRDGTMKIKFPGWGQDVLKSHILDASVIESVSGVDNWGIEPTRVLAVGSATQLQKSMSANSVGGNILYDLTVPVGLYIGNPRIPETEDYYSSSFQYFNQGEEMGSGSYDPNAAFAGEDAIRGNAISTPDWFDNLPNYRITSGHHTVNKSRPNHLGTDYGTKYETIYSIGTHGVVVDNGGIHKGMGWHVTIGQEIDGKYYEFKYMHFNKQSPLKIGDKVRPGQVVGQSGATGNVSGPHLHLEIWEGKWYKDKNLNAEAFLAAKRKQYANAQKVTPGSGGTAQYSPDFIGPRPADGSTTVQGGRFIDPNTISSWEKNKAFLDVSVPREADENVTLNNNVSAQTLNSIMKGRLANTGQYFIEYGIKYGIDPSFGVAISCQETGYGNSVSASNNIAGMMDPKTNWSTLIKFPTIQSGIEAFFKNLQKLYTSKGRITPRTIQSTYAPKGAKNDPRQLNKNWLPNVVGIWNRLRGNGSSQVAEFTPYASTTGTGIGVVSTSGRFKRVTEYINRTRVESLHGIQIEKELVYNDSLAPDKYPSEAFKYTNLIHAQKGKLSPGIIMAIAGVTSKWVERYETVKRVGLLGIHKNLLNGDKNNTMKVAAFNIGEAVDIINNARKNYFGGNVFFAIAGYFRGNMYLTASDYTNSGKDFQKFVKANSSEEYVKMTQNVIEEFLYIMGGYDYVKGNIHKDMTGRFFNINGKAKIMNSDGVLEDYSVEEGNILIDSSDLEVDSFEAKLSEEEKMYKINLVQVEQELIRMDSKALTSGSYADGSSSSDASTPDDSSVAEGPKKNENDYPKKKDDPKPLNPAHNEYDKFLNGLLNSGSGSDYKPSIYPNSLDAIKNKKNTFNLNAMSANETLDLLEKNMIPERITSRSTLNLTTPVSRARKLLRQEGVQLSTLASGTLGPVKQDLDGVVGHTNGSDTTQVLTDLMTLDDLDVPDYASEIDDLIYQYAKYNMQLHRAMAHDVNVNLTMCLPQLRVGFNMWLEPTRRDVVFYATRVSHSGSFGAGCKTSVGGAFVRSTKDYKFVSDNVFIGDQFAESKDFGEVAIPSQLQGIRNELKKLHESGGSIEAHKITTLSKLYGSQNKNNEYSTKWNSEKTPDEIEKMVKEEYSNAPDIIKEKIKKTRDVISESVETFVEKLHAYSMKG